MIGAILAKRGALAGFEVMNQRDLETAHKTWADDATLVYLEGVSGTYTGKADIEAWYQRLFDQFPSFHFAPKHVAVSNLFDIIGNNVVTVQWEGEMTNRDGFRMQNSGISFMIVKRAKVIHYHIYLNDTGEKLQTAWGTRQES